MGTLTALLHSTSTALLADQSALTATAENISNQNTTGYTRRSVTFSDSDTVTLGAGNLSSNVTATSTAVRDRILLRSVQQATEASSASSARGSALNTLQSFFAINSSGSDASGIGAAITSFFSAATSLASSPTDGTAQATAFTAAQTLASTLNRTAAQITSQTSTLNQQIASSVGQVNGLVTQVSSLNTQISTTPAGDGLDTLIDQRDQLVTQISGLVGVNAVSGPNNTVSLSLSDGTPLVSGSQTLALTTATISGTTHIFAAAAAGGADVTAAIQGGSIGGALQARDQDLPAVSSQLDSIAAAIATAVNTQNQAGTTAAGTAGGAIFSGSTAATISVSATSGSAIAVSSTTAGNGNNAAAIGNLQNAALVNGQTLSASFASLLSGVGQTASNASTASTAAAAVLSQNSTQLDALSGVSLDQEAANLTQYQRSYEAAAKVLAIVNELLAQAINLGVQTTVS